MKRAKAAPKAAGDDLGTALLAAAFSMVEAHGVEELSLRAAAKSVGVSEAAPYHHFADKHALETAVAAEGFRRLTRALGEGDGTLDEIARRYIGFALAHRNLFALMYRVPTARDPAQAELQALAEAAMAPLVGALARRLLPLAPTADAVGLAVLAAWTQIHGFAQILLGQGPMHPGADPARYVPRLARLVQFFEDGLETAIRAGETPEDLRAATEVGRPA